MPAARWAPGRRYRFGLRSAASYAGGAPSASSLCSSSCRWSWFWPSGLATTAATRAQRGFVDLAQESGANLVVFTLFASTSFLLIVIVALFAGDTVPSEASWSSLRYLLAAPVRRERLLRQKLVVAALSSVVALVFLPAWTLARRRHRVRLGSRTSDPPESQIGWPEFALRLVIIVGYLLLELSVVGAFAFMLGVLHRRAARRGRRRGAADDLVCDPRLDYGVGQHPAGFARALRVRVGRRPRADDRLFGHDHRRTLVIGYAMIAVWFAVWHFLRKDITS